MPVKLCDVIGGMLRWLRLLLPFDSYDCFVPERPA